MIFYDYRCNVTPKQCIDRLYLGMKHHPIGLFIIGLPNSSVDIPFLVRNSAKIVHPRLLLPLMLMREMIEGDRHITYREIQTSLGIDMKAIHTILHDHLSVRKLCSRWIPHNLIEVQKQARVKWSKEMLEKFNRGRSNLVYNIITGDMDLFV